MNRSAWEGDGDPKFEYKLSLATKMGKCAEAVVRAQAQAWG